MKTIKKIIFQKRKVETINEGTEHEKTIELVPSDRVIVHFYDSAIDMSSSVTELT